MQPDWYQGQPTGVVVKGDPEKQRRLQDGRNVRLPTPNALVIVVMVILFTAVISLVAVLVVLNNDDDDDNVSVTKPKQPNIVFVLADDLGYNDIGYNNPSVLTPNLDRLAKAGRTFTQHYMQPVCTPSRHTLLTGILPMKSGMQHFVLAAMNPHCSPTDMEFLPQKLKNVGYSTHLMGKWHLGFCQKDCLPTAKGFDTFYGLYGGQADQISHNTQPPDPFHYDWRDGDKIDYGANQTHTTDAITNKAIDLLEATDPEDGDPFFMLLTHTVPHQPLQAPQSFIDLYPNEPDQDRRTVLGMISHLDDSVKRLEDSLKSTGHWNNTVFIFASDNGGDVAEPHDNTPFRGGKGSLWEGGARTVSFINSPLLENLENTKTLDGLFHVSDWHATILAIAGANTDGTDGIDQTDMLMKGEESKRNEIVYNIDMVDPAYFGQAAIRVGDYKLIWGFEGDNDGWGPDAVKGYRYPDNLRSIGIDPDTDPYVRPPGLQFFMKTDTDRARENAMMAARKFSPDDIDSGSAHLFNIKEDPEERNDLISREDMSAKTLELKYRVLELLTEYVAPPETSYQFWAREALGALEQGAWATGWCDQLDLSRPLSWQQTTVATRTLETTTTEAPDTNLQKKPNILFVMADDLGYNDIGYNNPSFKTPTLDALATEGRTLTQHYMQPVCTPSRSTLMTGYLPLKTSMQHFVLAGDSPHCVPTNVRFLSEKLKDLNYGTHLIGKWHLGFCKDDCLPNRRGFDTFDGMYGGQGDQFQHTTEPPDPKFYDWRKDDEIDWSVQGTHSVDVITNRAIELMDNYEPDGDQPFFMLLTHTVPHHPLQAPEEFIDMHLDEADENKRLVKAMMSHLDDSVHRLVEKLNSTGHRDNTIIIFASDNGGDVVYHHDNYPYRGGKGSLYEGGCRTVSFVNSPLLESTPDVNEGLFHVSDWHTTILSLAGADEGDLQGDGVDQSDLIVKGEGSQRNEIIYNVDLVDPAFFGQAAIRIGDMKLIWGFPGYADGWSPYNATVAWYYGNNLAKIGIDPDNDPYVRPAETPSWRETDTEFARHLAIMSLGKFDPAIIGSGIAELYNLKDDPREMINLASEPSRTADILRLKNRILDILNDYLAPPPESLQHWIPKALQYMQNGTWATGWCPDLNFNIAKV